MEAAIMYRIYPDVCCLNRPFDDQTQTRVRLESKAVLLILARLEREEWNGLYSDALRIEIAQNPDAERRHRLEMIVRLFWQTVPLTPAITVRAQQIAALGFQAFDALHLACAESGSADVFLTTDDRPLRCAVTLANQLFVRAGNPLIRLKEITET